MSDDILRELGEIKGLLTGVKDEQGRQSGRMEKIDDRLRSVERRSAVNGAVAGGVIGIAIALVKDTFTSSG